MVRILFAVILGLVSTLSVAGEIRLAWSATSGLGTVGTSNISATTGDILSLDVIFDNTLGSGWAAVSLDFSSSPLSLQSVVPATTLHPIYNMTTVESNAGMPALYDGTGDGAVGLPDLMGIGSALFTPFGPYDFNGDAVVNFTDVGLMSSNYGAGSFTLPSATNSLYISIGGDLLTPATLVASQLLATLNFQVTGVGVGNIDPFFNAGIDGVFDGSRQNMTTGTTLTGATLNGGASGAVPEPGVLYLLSMGLLTIAWVRRRVAF